MTTQAQRNASLKWYYKNKEAVLQKRREYRINNKDKLLLRERKNDKDPTRIKHKEDRRLKRLYGITSTEYDNLFTKQNGLCAICKSTKSTNSKKFHIDHNHTNGKVRALLCNHCNIGLGHFKDSINLLQTAIEYIKQYENN